MLVPEGRWLHTVTRDRFGAGQRTELVVLSEVIELANGVLCVKNKPTGYWQVNEAATASYVLREPTVCVVHDHEGRRELTARQYQELVAGVEVYDLFVDMTAVVKGGGCRGGRRLPDGTYEEVALTRNEAAVVVELALAGRAMRAGEFRSVTANTVGKIMEHARRKLDVSLGRYEWRTIQTLKANVPEAKAFQFRASEGVKWGVVATVVDLGTQSIGPKARVANE